jgi:hypothetical protein
MQKMWSVVDLLRRNPNCCSSVFAIWCLNKRRTQFTDLATTVSSVTLIFSFCTSESNYSPFTKSDIVFPSSSGSCWRPRVEHRKGFNPIFFGLQQALWIMYCVTGPIQVSSLWNVVARAWCAVECKIFTSHWHIYRTILRNSSTKL